MNVQLKDITVTARDGRVSHLDQVYIRGSHVRFFIVPDMLRYVAWLPGWLEERLTMQKRAHVPLARPARSRCWVGAWEGDRAEGEGAEKGLAGSLISISS